MANKIVTDYIALLKYQIDEAGKKRFDNAVSDSKRRVDALAVSLKTVGEAMKNMGSQTAFGMNALSGHRLVSKTGSSNGAAAALLSPGLGIPDITPGQSGQKIREGQAELNNLKAVGNDVLTELKDTLTGDLAPLLKMANDGVLELKDAFTNLSPEAQEAAKQIGAVGLGVMQLMKVLSSAKKAADALKGLFGVGKTAGSALATVASSSWAPLAGLAAGSFMADVAMTRKRADSVMEANTGGDYIGLLFNGVDSKRSSSEASGSSESEPIRQVTNVGASRVAGSGNARSRVSGAQARSRGSRSRVSGTRAPSSSGVGKNGVSKNDVMRFFMSQNWTKEQAAGITANLWHESRFDPASVGDSGKAYGLAQWHPDRQKIFKKLFGKDIRRSSVNEQLEFVQYELTHNEKNAGRRLKNARTARDAGSIVSRFYERPKEVMKEAGSRGDTASEFNQTINITVNGATSPQETADAINQNLQGLDFGTRNMKSPVAP
ncbi:phage tail tip lysozyme [uncultured Oxalobacter sp.]|uniref:phage tail tip lysozyme n=1 Tax=uncultured Oxalobacter sp. TaxID=337245 RepID=UPI002593C64B|nr:phage tail tip lysozyme [uncultured Oxalobacter sp.]